MKNRAPLGLTLIALCATSSAAFAQTKPTPPAPAPVDIPASAYGPVWTGFYAGVAFGTDMMINRSTITAGTTAVSNDMGGTGALGSIYGGIDYQIAPKALIGAMAEVTYGGLDSTAAASAPGANATITNHADWSWSAVARAGFLPTPSTLFYGLGGYTGQNIQTTASAGGASFTQSNTFNGWTLGAGMETMLGNGWSAKFEYRFSQYETKTLPGTTITLSPSSHAARIGLTYHFGGLNGGSSAQDAPADAGSSRNWTGFYGGAAGGVGAMTDHLNATLGSASGSVDSGGDGLLGGFFGGADYQFAPQALVGVMGDYTWSGIQSNSSLALGGAFGSTSTRQSNSWSILGRLGFLPTSSTLIYAAGGYTSATFTTTANAGGFTTSHDDVLGGWTLGPGVEMMIADNWSTRLEYRYSQFASVSSNGVTGQPSTQTVRAGLAYHFPIK
ncbi:MAG: porin family protein [Alphaproteobacteria bacterium]|nr:porin family protein [Alphaproteobacteria bacterium]